jgi:hypothetical protein
MKVSTFAIAAAAFIAVTANAADKVETPTPASPAMTCQSFGEALWRAIGDAGDMVVKPDLDAIEYRNPDGSNTRYKIRNIAGVEGQLVCGKADRMDNFDVSIDVDLATNAVRVYRLTALAAASICAVIPDKQPDACKKLADTLLDGAIMNHAKASVRGKIDPSGLRTEKLKGGFKIDFSSSEGERGFVLYRSLTAGTADKDDDEDVIVGAPVVPDLKAGEGFIDSVPPIPPK